MKFGIFAGFAAALTLVVATPVLAQNSETPVDVTAAPPPSAETIGPAQLRDFNLQGTVTRPADRPAATPAQPTDTATAPPRSGEAVPSEAAAISRSPVQSTAQRAPSAPPAEDVRSIAGLERTGRPPITPSLPLDVATDPAPQPEYNSGIVASPTDPESGPFSWTWLGIPIALIAGGGFILWSRRNRSRRYGDPGRMAFAGMAPEAAPEAQPVPPGRPRADPVPPRAQLRPDPRPDPFPSRGAHQETLIPKPTSDGTIVATSLKPQLNVEFHADRVVVTEHEVMLMFEIVITNVGSAPARDVLVHAELFTAHVGQDREIATFFQNPAVDGDRMASIVPLGRVSLKSMARLPLGQAHHFEAGGRKLFVPLVGLNIIYRFGSSDGQASASFLIGRGSEEDEKLAPFRIDQGPRIFRGLSARTHIVGMQTA